MSRSVGSSPLWLRTRTLAVVGAFVLAGCGSSGGDDTSSSEQRETATTVANDDPSDVTVDDDGDDEQPVAGGEPVSHLPFDVEAPAGHKMVAAECDANAEALAAATEAGDHASASPIVFAVPEDWVNNSKGSGGSGGVTGTGVDLGFKTDVGTVEVAFAWEKLDQESGWESFDRESNNNGTITTIEYEQVASGVTVGDQSVDIFYRELTEESDRFEGEEYKARVLAFDLPYSPFMTANGLDEYSLVFTITLDSDSSGMDQGMIESIIESVSLPTCVWDDLLLSEEVVRQADLNGDGEFKTMEEWQAELQQEIAEATDAADD